MDIRLGRKGPAGSTTVVFGEGSGASEREVSIVFMVYLLCDMLLCVLLIVVSRVYKVSHYFEMNTLCIIYMYILYYYYIFIHHILLLYHTKNRLSSATELTGSTATTGWTDTCAG